MTERSPYTGKFTMNATPFANGHVGIPITEPEIDAHIEAASERIKKALSGQIDQKHVNDLTLLRNAWQALRDGFDPRSV
jgi:hypothetical protein